MIKKPIIQIAGVRSLEEAQMLAEEGATQIGFPLRLDSHSEDTTDDEARRIISALPQDLSKALITYLTDSREITQLADFLGVDTVQLHGGVTRKTIQSVRESRPKLTIIRSLIVSEDQSDDLVSAAQSFAHLVDYFLTDTYDRATGASGATGKTHDWAVSRRLVTEAGKPVILAGGLTPGNVRRAIFEVRPAGVDSHTGVEVPDGSKDRALVRAFVREARKAFAAWTTRFNGEQPGASR